jgi:predicted HTH transcriptional regulator
MKHWYILVYSVSAILLSWSFLPQPTLADVLSNPTLNSNAPQSAQDKTREAARQSLHAQCKIFESMKSYATSSNELIQSAAKEFSLASENFQSATQILSKDDKELSISEEDAVKAAATLSRLGYETPKTFAATLKILSQASDKAAKNLSQIKYDDKIQSNIQVLRSLKNISGEAAEVFIAISTLTALAKKV